MRHYHGTPIGGKRAGADEFAERRCLLVPWKRPEDLQRAMDYSRGFIADNSAYSFWRTGETPDWQQYADWIATFCRCPRFDWALIPDVIEGGEKENDALLKWWALESHWPHRIASVPVWHMHESFDRLERLLMYDCVAIGSSGDYPTPGVGKWWDRMDDAFRVICDRDGFPRRKIHGLRMLDPEIVRRYPFASCDSTNAVQNGAREARKSNVDSTWGQMTIARRLEYATSPSRWTEPARQLELMPCSE